MTTLVAAQRQNAGAWRVRDAASWLALAGSPTFGLMAWIAATDTPRMSLCASGMLPIDGMAWMYLLMSLFHLSPWLKLAADRRRRFTRPAQKSHPTCQN